jgi:hypothetical protein
LEKGFGQHSQKTSRVAHYMKKLSFVLQVIEDGRIPVPLSLAFSRSRRACLLVE